jgi:hypothetical protein
MARDGLGGVSPFLERWGKKVASTLLGNSGNLAMLFVRAIA